MVIERQVDPKEVHNAAHTKFVQALRNLKEAKDQFASAGSHFKDALGQANSVVSEANKARLALSEEEIQNRGLAICDDTEGHRIWDPKQEKSYTASDLGIFPQEAMRIYYTRRFWYTKRPDYENADEWGKEEKLELFCPDHFPKDGDRRIPSNCPNAEGQKDIYSQVVKGADKFRRTVDGFDVTLFTLVRLANTHLANSLNRDRIMDFLGVAPKYSLPQELEQASL